METDLGKALAMRLSSGAMGDMISLMEMLEEVDAMESEERELHNPLPFGMVVGVGKFSNALREAEEEAGVELGLGEPASMYSFENGMDGEGESLVDKEALSTLVRRIPAMVDCWYPSCGDAEENPSSPSTASLSSVERVVVDGTPFKQKLLLRFLPLKLMLALVLVSGLKA